MWTEWSCHVNSLSRRARGLLIPGLQWDGHRSACPASCFRTRSADLDDGLGRVRSGLL